MSETGPTVLAHSRRRAVVVASLAIVGLVAATCASCAPRRARAPSTDAPSRGEPTATGDVGLTIVRWHVPADPAARRRALDELVRDEVMAPCATPLAAHGMLAYRAPLESLASIADALGGAGAGSRRLDLGQAREFADLLALPIARGTPVLADGRPERADEAFLRLEARGWCFPTVEGAAARVELRLVEDETRIAAISTDPSRVRPPTRELRKGSVALELAAAEALVLLDMPVAPPEKDSADPLAALPPPSRAALLFGSTPTPDRVAVLVIVPSFGDMLPSQDPLVAPAEIAPAPAAPE